jgi:hypothetical protein
MKKVIIILVAIVFVTVSYSGQSNNQNVNMSAMFEKVDIIGHWRIDAIIGLELEPKSQSTKTDEYTLHELQKEDSTGFGIYGWTAEFRSDGTFESHYATPDGYYNSNSTGTYQFIDEYHIRIHIGEVNYHIWDNEQKPKIELGVFLIAAIKNGFRLIKFTDDETDLQRLAYSDMLRRLPTSLTAPGRLIGKKLDPYNRDTDNLKILNKGLVAYRYNPDKAKLVYSRNICSGWDCTTAFIFLYEGENIIALYSRGLEIFNVLKKNE